MEMDKETGRDRRVGLKGKDKGRPRVRVKGREHDDQLGLESWLIRLNHPFGHEVR
jgi:hypothetical protein